MPLPPELFMQHQHRAYRSSVLYFRFTCFRQAHIFQAQNSVSRQNRAFNAAFLPRSYKQYFLQQDVMDSIVSEETDCFFFGIAKEAA